MSGTGRAYAFRMWAAFMMFAVQAAAQEIEVKRHDLGTGYDRETRILSGVLPEQKAVVSRAEHTHVICFTAIASHEDTVIYHVWLYRGKEESPAAPRVFSYDSLTKKTETHTPRQALEIFSDLKDAEEIKAGLVVKLRVGRSPFFRTHSVKRIDLPPSLGTWECRVYSADGKLLSKRSFTVTAD